MFAFYTFLNKRAKLCVFLIDLESDTFLGLDHRNLIGAFVYSDFDMDEVLELLIKTHQPCFPNFDNFLGKPLGPS